MKLWGVAVVGVLLGLVGGLIVTWFIAPVEYYDTYPPMLDAAYRQDWIRMAAWSYALEGNWRRLETRLVNLPAAEVRGVVAGVLEEAIAREQSVTVLQRLAELAAAYGVSSPGVAIYGEGELPPTVTPAVTQATQPAPTPTRAPTVSVVLPTLRPTPTMMPAVPITDTLPVLVVSQTLTCDPSPVIAVSLTLSRTVEVRGRERQEIVELPMREIWLIWDEGADRAITGFRPELGLGYADFDVVPGRSYNLYVDSPYGIPIRTLQVEPCPPAEGVGWVSRHLILQEVAPEPRDPEMALTATPSVTLTATLTTTLTAVPTITATTGLTGTAAPGSD